MQRVSSSSLVRVIEAEWRVVPRWRLAVRQFAPGDGLRILAAAFMLAVLGVDGAPVTLGVVAVLAYCSPLGVVRR